jgi:gas vesicle structural protein
MTDITPLTSPHCELALSELLDRVLNKGVIVIGDATISIANVDLIYVGVKLLLSSVETAERLRPASALSSAPACEYRSKAPFGAKP